MAVVNQPTVTLRPMGEEDVLSVIAAAVAGSLPREVMPPDDDPDPQTWTKRRAAGLAVFLRSRLSPLADGRRETSYVVQVDDRAVGVARLLPHASGEMVEAGLWLVADVRGYGVGGRVLALLAAQARARGGTELIADTTSGNAAALAVLRRGAARLTASVEHPGTVNARLFLSDG